ncbi:hypothetical protein CLUG_02099 [Clavispora lusitaniae ATCC 42720]|uniref:Uncharacterized protein n=1 Tax=Clavispora lusitaniae (strain ATCC 42720) TaxID=306902 RepID=C4Y1L7_CLAL4|nr:uncharacterized protein CLUG_02099 [Clavispora lusitaniae ATCC 42720]EEQ37976.1 hypothetical protein CLUG_02099 [Clavispora lusitaniae ATCC 42720]KAF5211714.1 hypothetical protein E0198_001255 [Clavispora lusitaniae]
MITFTELGEDIIVANLCQFLSPIEIFNLSLTCKQLHSYLTSNEAYHLLFLYRFGKLTPLNLKEYDWEHLFKKRCAKNLNFYTWGSANQGRLGYLLRDIPDANRSQLYFGVHTPTKVPNFDSSVIDQVHAGGYSFQLLTKGKIYCIGANYCGSHGSSTPGPLQNDYVPRIDSGRTIGFVSLTQPRLATEAGLRAVHHRIPDNPNLRLPPEQLEFPPELERTDIEETSFVTKMSLPSSWDRENRKIVNISSGRKHFLALDDEGAVFTWDSGNSDWKTGVQVIFPGLHGRIRSVSAGWNLSSCFMTGVGIVVWYSRDSITKEDYEASKFKAKANYIVIPGSEAIVDYIALQDSVMYIRDDGDLFKFHINASAMANGHENCNDSIWNVPMKAFNSWLAKFNKQNKMEATFTKLSGCYQSFAIFTNHGQVLLGKQGSDDEANLPKVIPELQNKGIIQISMGDYHYLALTDKGKLLSWGLEPQNSGCLGLGNLSEIADETITTENRNHIVTEPHEVKNPSPNGKWLAVSTSGWHAGGLYISE